MIAAVANAIHDATGVRIRRVPFRDTRVLAALKAAKRITWLQRPLNVKLEFEVDLEYRDSH